MHTTRHTPKPLSLTHTHKTSFCSISKPPPSHSTDAIPTIVQGVDMSPEFGSPHTLTLLGNTLRLIGRHSDAVSRPSPSPLTTSIPSPLCISNSHFQRPFHRRTTMGSEISFDLVLFEQVPYYRRAISLDPSYPKAYLQVGFDQPTAQHTQTLRFAESFPRDFVVTAEDESARICS